MWPLCALYSNCLVILRHDSGGSATGASPLCVSLMSSASCCIPSCVACYCDACHPTTGPRATTPEPIRVSEHIFTGRHVSKELLSEGRVTGKPGWRRHTMH